MRAAVDAGIKVPKLCATDSLEPFGSCRLCLVEIEGRRGYPGVVHHAGRGRHEGAARRRRKLQRTAQGRDGALHLRPSARLPDLRRQRRLRAAGHGRRRRPAQVRYGYDGAQPPRSARRTSRTRTSPTTRRKCIVCYRCVRACEETQGTFALTISGRGFESRVSPGKDESFMDSECVSCGACVAGLPDRDAAGEVGDRARPGRAQRHHHLRLLRRRLRLQGRDEGQRGRAHGAVEGRQGQRGPFLRQGPLRLGLRDAQGPHH